MLVGEDSDGRRPRVAEPSIPSCSQLLLVNAIGVASFVDVAVGSSRLD